MASTQRIAVAKLHGGVLNDNRSQSIKLVGDRIFANVEPDLRTGLQFELLADQSTAASYAFDDGSIFLTLGLARLTEYDSEIAAALCDVIERLVRSRHNVPASIPYGALSERWMQRAGFDPADLEVVRRRIAALATGRVDS